MVSRSLVLAFHGCDDVVARRIVAEKDDFRPRQRSYHWLGQGVYFWEDSPSRAWQWAIDARQKGQIKKAAVIGAVIDLGHCLNLVDPEALALVREAHAKYLELCARAGQEPEANRGEDLRARNLDCEVFTTLHRLREEAGQRPFETVRAFFTEGEPLYAGSGLRMQDHIQICVRDSARIVGCFYPRGSDAAWAR